MQHDGYIYLPKPAYRYLLQGMPLDKHLVSILNKTTLPEFGIRSRSITSYGDLYFKTKPHWLSTCLVRHLCLSAWTLASVTTKDCSCQNRARTAGLKGSLLPNHCKPVHSGNICPTGCPSIFSKRSSLYRVQVTLRLNRIQKNRTP